ncbi:MAG: D-alanyl-D-alanine carboxypeptidase family protein [Anaerovoracaceae bacterium]|jgi:D-alanyl-D-alanine carboxypeptidase (penicillin-binding protein 5/6)
MKKVIALVIAISLFLGTVQMAFATGERDVGADDPLELVAQAAILMDGGSGEILYEKNKDVQHFPASTTKMLTSILAIERLDLSETIPVDSETPFTEGSRMYLIEDEIITGEEMMYGMMLDSANDAAVAFAKKISGTVEEFAGLMNKKAKKLGAKNSNFVNPNGLHEKEHVSTAYDLAMIARYCMANDTFRKYVGTYSHIIPATNKQQERPLHNTNRLLYDENTKVVVGGVERPCKYEGVTGIKTGYTSHAQGCLVASAKKGDMELIAVVLASTDLDRFRDCIAMLDYGFENFKTVKVFEANTEVDEIKIKRGKVNRIPVITAETANIVMPIDGVERSLRWEAEIYPSLRAPVKRGEKAGTIKVYQGDILLGEFDAVAAKAVPEGGILSLLGVSDGTIRIIKKWILGLLVFFLALLIAYIILKRRQIKRKKKRKAERMRKKELERQRPYGAKRKLDDPIERIEVYRDSRRRYERKPPF